MDDALHIYWVAYSSVHATNTDERGIFPPDFAQLRQRLPDLPISALVADAALGYTPYLQTIYAARAIPVVDLRADPATKIPSPVCCAATTPTVGPSMPTATRCAATASTMTGCALPGSVARPAPVTSSLPPRRSIAPSVTPSAPSGWSSTSNWPTHPDGSTHARLARLYPYRSALWKQPDGSRRNTRLLQRSFLLRYPLRVPPLGCCRHFTASHHRNHCAFLPPNSSADSYNPACELLYPWLWGCLPALPLLLRFLLTGSLRYPSNQQSLTDEGIAPIMKVEGALTSSACHSFLSNCSTSPV